MDSRIKQIKGIHPGIFLAKELKKKNIAKGPFALSIGVYPQTLGEITLGKRNMNTLLAIKIEQALGLEEGTLMILQVFFNIKKEKKKNPKNISPDLTKLRKALFWDTKIENVDWIKHQKFVTDRVNERGTPEEKEEIQSFYTSQEVQGFIKTLSE
jgi:antitoxin HigA-1